MQEELQEHEHYQSDPKYNLQTDLELSSQWVFNKKLDYTFFVCLCANVVQIEYRLDSQLHSLSD